MTQLAGQLYTGVSTIREDFPKKNGVILDYVQMREGATLPKKLWFWKFREKELKFWNFFLQVLKIMENFEKSQIIISNVGGKF